jgi:putative addiction module component (TIGR02574 family)
VFSFIEAPEATFFISHSAYGFPAFARICQSGYTIVMKQDLVAEILELPVDERLRLVEAIWDSISVLPDAIALTDWQREELDRRLAEYEANPDSGVSMEEVFSRIKRDS